MSTLQELLNKEAQLSNAGKGDSQERQDILKNIRIIRKNMHQPLCFGQDDCSTNMLSVCPWRMDCGGAY
jgi:hypothetical protein